MRHYLLEIKHQHISQKDYKFADKRLPHPIHACRCHSVLDIEEFGEGQIEVHDYGNEIAENGGPFQFDQTNVEVNRSLG